MVGPKENTWYTRPMMESPHTKLMDMAKSQDWYKGPFNITINTTPWYKDISTWLWLGGIASVIGAAYFGYKFLTDPTFITDFSRNRVLPNDNGINLDNPNIASGSNLAEKVKDLGKNTADFFTNIVRGTRYYLNPLNFIGTQNVDTEAFMQRQMTMNNTTDLRYYPFTNVNPYAPWYSRIKLLLIGETATEFAQRTQDRLHSIREFTPIMLSDNRSGTMTPVASIGMGLGLNPNHSLPEMIGSSNMWNKLSSVPGTPNIANALKPLLPEFNEGSSSSWVTNPILESDID